MKPITRYILSFSLWSWLLFFSGCARVLADPAGLDRSRTPFVVAHSLAPDASPKTGVQAITNTGAQIFANAILDHQTSGHSGFGGTVSFPTSVRVTWREGVTSGLYWTTGTVVGDYTVDVRNRIPAKFFEMAKAAPKRVVKLQFRIKDDKVLFAWCVQETRGTYYVDILHDGDFKKPTIVDGVVTDPGWER